MGYQVNIAALIASPRLSQRWIDCDVRGANSVGQLYVFPAPGGPRFAPQFVLPRFVREVTEVTHNDDSNSGR